MPVDTHRAGPGNMKWGETDFYRTLSRARQQAFFSSPAPNTLYNSAEPLHGCSSMLLSSQQYLVFLGLFFAVWWLAAPRRGLILALAVAANCFFYLRWSWLYLALIPACAFADFFLGQAIHITRSAAARRLLLALSVLLNITLILSSRLPEVAVPLLLPLSLSFYGFQAMTYTIDIYRRDARPVPSFATYLASVAFFPTTLAGPITRVASLAPQWQRLARPLADNDGSRALFLIGLGMSKKFLIADYLADHLVNRVFDTPSLYSAAESLIAAYAYAFQLYYDFSGYTDIALGSALLLGIKLPANFNRPYQALNVVDFWRRWHISLSNWLRDYLFFSLPGKRSAVMPYVNLVLTMLLGGLWHGLSWTFFIWGGLHGLGLAVTRGWQAWRGRREGTRAGQFIARLATFHFVVLAWVFFRAPSAADALHVLSRIVSLDPGIANVTGDFAMVLIVAALLHYLPDDFYKTLLFRFERAPALVQAMALAAVAIGIQYVASTGSAPFVYQRF
jgi:D-alanyl-lipoteichoic acid acyltransferase DltB (MBOAT superfamily)